MADPNTEDVATVDDVVATFAAADHRVVFSDFDGTLADIVDQPAEATIRPDSRTALAELAANPRTDVAVVSGRALEDVAERVGLDELWYAGNHGLEISIDDESFVHPTANDQRGAITAACDRIHERLSDVDGVMIERKDLTATIHFRMADDEAVERIRGAVEDVVATDDGFEVHHAKQGFELRPAIDWDKGRAVEWILERCYDDRADVYPLYIGDDVSDESAFEVLQDRGAGIRVGDDGATAADVTVADPSAVTALLEQLRDSREDA